LAHVDPFTPSISQRGRPYIHMYTMPYRACAAIAGAFLSMASALVLETRTELAESRAEGHKYAITGSWIPWTTPKDNETAMTACPLALSLRGGMVAARAAIPSSERNSTTIDRVLYTVPGELGAEAVRFLEERGVVVKDILADPIMKEAHPYMTSGFGSYVNQMKLSYLWATQYDAVLQLDHDIIFTTTPDVDMLGTVATGNKTMFTFEGSGTLIAGGILAVRPSREFAAGVLRGIKHGLKLEDGYGGDYPENLANMTLAKHLKHCSVFQSTCCKDPSVPKTWCFGGANCDQGMLLDLALSGGRDRRVSHGSGDWGRVGVWQPTLMPKPWRMDLLPELKKKGKMRDVERFWHWWENSGSVLLKDDPACSAYYKQGLDAYRQYQKRR